MKKLTVILMSFMLLAVISPCTWLQAQDKASTGAMTYSETEGTAYHRAVFAHYLAVIPNADPSMSVNCAISISNVCAVPDNSSLGIYLGGDGTPTSGGFAIILYDREGEVYYFSSRDNSMIGYYSENNYNNDGVLNPGETFTVNLQEVLAAVKGSSLSDAGEFVGYGWVLSEFDCLAGTYSNTIYGLGFTQAFELKPAMGQGYQFGGLMLPVD